MKNILLLMVCITVASFPLQASAAMFPPMPEPVPDDWNPRPDLMASTTTVSPSSATVGQTVSFSGTISNISSDASKTPGFPNTFKIVKLVPQSSSSTQITTSENQTVHIATTSLVRVAASPVISFLATNESFSPLVSGSYIFTTSGTYAVALCANINTAWNLNNSVNESNLDNNCGTWQLITVIKTTGNEPPLAPVINGPPIGPPNTSYSFRAHDPENGRLKYQIDWYSDDFIELEIPSATYFPSDTWLYQAKNWKTLGVVNFKVRAVDIFGAAGAWSPYTVSLRCDPFSTWDPVDLSCPKDVEVIIFTAAPSVATGYNTNLTAGRISGGGTITCSINGEPVPLGSSGNISKNSGPLTTTTTFTLVCGNGVGPNVSKSLTVVVGGAPVNGACGSIHNACAAGTSQSAGESASEYTWTCAGVSGTDASCRETKTSASTFGNIASPASVTGVIGAALALTTAVGAFGGYDLFGYTVTCEMPRFLLNVPNCSLIPGTEFSAACSAGIPAPPQTPPALFFYDYFIFLKGLIVPSSGFLAVSIVNSLMFPSYALFPGEWAIGFVTPGGPKGGFYIPGFPSTPYSPCNCIPSRCIPIIPAAATVTPFTGAAPGGIFGGMF
ncbi:MAG: hypothetical protein AAB794_00055 [Patescibacteria group bacterium]